MIRVWLITIRCGKSWAFFASREHGIRAYRTRGEAKEDLAAARKQFGKKDVMLMAFISEAV